MRLVDKVAQAPAAQHYPEDPGGGLSVQGAGAFRDLVSNCSLRYVLDRDASTQVTQVARRELLVPGVGDDFARPPADLMWFEYFADGGVDGELGRRIGTVAQFDAGGRSGTLIPFGERRDGGADFLHCGVRFDWDSTSPSFGMELPEHRIRQADLPCIDTLLRHARTIVSEPWLRRCDQAGVRRTDAVRRICESTWSILPTLTAFCAMLNSSRMLRETASDLTKVNAARARGRRPLLLDHVEVRLDLASVGVPAGTSSAEGDRAVPRLHLVRGHTVTRAGKSFWRSSHLRGEGDEVLRRTVSVTSRLAAGASQRRPPRGSANA